MPKLFSVRFSLTRNALIVAGLSLTLAACDREAANPAQEQGALADGKQSLSGVIDRSFEGELMPTVTVRDQTGGELNVAALQGANPILINLWATWCAPCKVEMPMLNKLAQEYGDGLRVLTVSQDFKNLDKVAPFLTENNLEMLEPWLDPENALGFGIGGGVLPTTVLYDSGGQEVWRVVGDFDWSGPEARAAIDEAIEADGI